MEVVDLHCDLLFFLAHKTGRNPSDPVARCSLPQLKSGNVKTQTLAIYSDTDSHSVHLGEEQIQWYLKLESEGCFIPAFENASTFALEDEPLQTVFDRFEAILEKLTPLYISLTWNGENRFGGGCGVNVGLKPDGKELIHFLSGKGIHLDFSHTSDRLAHEIFEEIEKSSLSLPVLASHSNFRAVFNQERNLPDSIAKEIIRRGGLIGLVFYSKFLKNPDQLFDQIHYGLELGAELSLCFGADFFYTADLSVENYFFDEMSDASKYPSILERLTKQGISESLLKAISHENATRIIQKSACFSR